MSMQRDLDFLYEIGSLRHIDRVWRQFLHGKPANNAEHQYRVAWIALIIAKHEGAVNTDKILKMALAHDIAETRTGDVNYLTRQYVVRHEDMALQDLTKGVVLADEILELMDEYIERKSIESQIVKDADNLDVDLELCELAAEGNNFRAREKQLMMRRHVRDTKMYTKTGRKMAEAIQKSDPHAWHELSERNRINGGDWKK